MINGNCSAVRVFLCCVNENRCEALGSDSTGSTGGDSCGHPFSSTSNGPSDTETARTEGADTARAAGSDLTRADRNPTESRPSRAILGRNARRLFRGR